MSNGEGIGVDVLLDAIDTCIHHNEKATEEQKRMPSPLCGIHTDSIIVLLRCEKHRLLRSRTLVRWGAIGSLVAGFVVTAIYIIEKVT